MKFKLKTSASFYNEKGKKKLEKLGFAFEPHEGWPTDRPFYIRPDIEPEIELKTLEELVAFAAKWNEVIVSNDGVLTLEIYDSYRE